MRELSIGFGVWYPDTEQVLAVAGPSVWKSRRFGKIALCKDRIHAERRAGLATLVIGGRQIPAQPILKTVGEVVSVIREITDRPLDPAFHEGEAWIIKADIEGNRRYIRGTSGGSMGESTKHLVMARCWVWEHKAHACLAAVQHRELGKEVRGWPMSTGTVVRVINRLLI